MQCREKVTLAACTRTCTRLLLPSVVCVGCRTFEGLKGNFSKAISGVLVSEWVGVDSFGRGGGERGGCIHSLLDGEKCSAAEMHSKVFFGGGGWGSCMSSTTIRFFGWSAALAWSGPNGRKRGESV